MFLQLLYEKKTCFITRGVEPYKLNYKLLLLTIYIVHSPKIFRFPFTK